MFNLKRKKSNQIPSQIGQEKRRPGAVAQKLEISDQLGFVKIGVDGASNAKAIAINWKRDEKGILEPKT